MIRDQCEAEKTKKRNKIINLKGLLFSSSHATTYVMGHWPTRGGGRECVVLHIHVVRFLMWCDLHFYYLSQTSMGYDLIPPKLPIRHPRDMEYLWYSRQGDDTAYTKCD